MRTSLIVGPDEFGYWTLTESRFGPEQSGLCEDIAEGMLHVQYLMEKASIKPGDSIKVLRSVPDKILPRWTGKIVLRDVAFGHLRYKTLGATSDGKLPVLHIWRIKSA